MLPKFVRNFLERRRFPTLMLIAAAVFIVNLFVPDPLLIADEILMLIATIVIGSFRKRRKSKPETSDS